MKPERAIRRFVVEDLLEGIDPAGDPLEEGLLDSLAIEQLIGFIEDRFGVHVDDEDVVAANFSSLESLAHLVERKQRAATAV